MLSEEDGNCLAKAVSGGGAVPSLLVAALRATARRAGEDIGVALYRSEDDDDLRLRRSRSEGGLEGGVVKRTVPEARLRASSQGTTPGRRGPAGDDDDGVSER